MIQLRIQLVTQVEAQILIRKGKKPKTLNITVYVVSVKFYDQGFNCECSENLSCQRSMPTVCATSLEVLLADV